MDQDSLKNIVFKWHAFNYGSMRIYSMFAYGNNRPDTQTWLISNQV